MKHVAGLCLLLLGCIVDREIGQNGGQNGDGGDDATARYSILAEGPPYAFDVVADVDAVYWVVSDQGPRRSSVHRVSKAGGAADELARFGKSVNQLAVDETHVYLPIYGPYGEISRLPKAGGPMEVLVSDLNAPYRIALDDDYAYYSEVGTEVPSIARVPKAGGTPEPLLTNDSLADLAVDDTYLYYAAAGRVMRVQKGGGTPEELAGGFLSTSHIAVDAATVYFTACTDVNCDRLWVHAVDKHGGMPRLLAILDGGGVQDMTLAAGYLFLAGGRAGTVIAIPPSRGVPQTLVTDRPHPMGVAADDDASRVYWVDFASGEVGRTDVAVDIVY